ncbi:MAG: hypothetical protein ACOC3Z_02030 [Nanoarchaeota archaeon]
MKKEEAYNNENFQNPNFRLKDLEEKEKLNKEKILLLSHNLIEIKQKTRDELTNIKKEIDILKSNIEKINSFLETISEEMPKFAKKEQLNILAKQAKMFQPLKK